MTYASDTISEIRQAVAVVMQDAGGLNYTDDEIDAAIQRALVELSEARPLMAEATLTLIADGGEIRLSDYAAELPGFDMDALLVDDVFSPYEPGEEREEQVNQVRAYFVERIGEDCQLVLLSKGSTPQSGDKVWLRYAVRREVNGLDGALETRLFPEEVINLVRGAAAHLAQISVIDHAEANPEILRGFAERELATWKRILESYGRSAMAKAAPFSQEGWGGTWDEVEKGSAG